MKSVKGRQFNKKKFYLEPEKVLIIKQVFLGIFLFSLVSLILTGVWYGTRLQSLTISDVGAVDSETIQGEVVKAKVAEVLDGNYWHFIPRRFAWFYPETEIYNKLAEIERIKDVRVEQVSNTELAVTFSEYLPYALWCNENNKNCHFIDKTGFAFGKAPELSGESLVRYHKLGGEPQMRTIIMSETDFDKTKKFSGLLASKGWYVVEVEVDSVRDVFYILSDKSEIRATLEADTDKTFGFFEALKNSKEFAHLAPGNFQYIDLRFGEKVYVNEQNNVATASSTDAITKTEVVTGSQSENVALTKKNIQSTSSLNMSNEEAVDIVSTNTTTMSTATTSQ